MYAPETLKVEAKLPIIAIVLALLFAIPVPPKLGTNRPPTETAPLVAVEGVSPVVPKLMVDTPEAGVPNDKTPAPFVCRTWLGEPSDVGKTSVKFPLVPGFRLMVPVFGLVLSN